MIDISDKLNELAARELRALAERDKHGWESGKFRKIRSMQPDKKGDLGEDFIVWLLQESGRSTTCTRRTDPTNKQWDIRVDSDSITLEVKTATLGYSNSTFQHEGLEQNRRCDGIVFLDISPDTLYITCFCKHTFNWKAAHHRRYGVQFKKDLTLKWLKESGHEVRNIDDFERQYAPMLAEIRRWHEKQRDKPI